ncbi:RNA polymerase sigma factor [Anaerostipes sp.]|uniref:RNA polymerase sigma factor n=1 Tax=Anaerostipes sp. TaxID=1872530 RepID=UPI0025C01B5E|nr:sigma-70 family RNA polymerase sigma factor [Anaerostipes sp.]MBS7009643.1 sigma-70 family RNA polymerase sigma factor [Anaerostipes sp.]
MKNENIYEKLCPFVEKAKQGDEEAFEYLYHSTYELTRRFVMNFCGSRSEAEDIIQDIYMDVYRYLPSLKDNMAFYAWLKQITYHSCVKETRVHKTSNIGDENIEFIKSIAEREHEPLEAVLEDEKNRLLYDCIRQLPEKQKAALILNALEQLKMSEVAEILDCSVNAVKNLLFHARKNLKKQIESLPKEDREALNIRGFGFFSVYPLLRSMIPASRKAEKGTVVLKKVIAGAATAAGIGAALFIFLRPEQLPAHSFEPMVLPPVHLETGQLKGIKIPVSEKPIKKKPPKAFVNKIKIENKTKRLAVYVDQNVDLTKAYAETASGKNIQVLEYRQDQRILYFSAKEKDFNLYLTDTAGNTKIIRFYKDK